MAYAASLTLTGTSATPWLLAHDATPPIFNEADHQYPIAEKRGSRRDHDSPRESDTSS
jgi:hypothetical protein